VKGLELDDFLLREEGKPQQISLVKEGQPVSVVILVDGMVCIWPPELEFQRSHEALRQLGEGAEIALMAWDSNVALVQPVTTDLKVIASRLGDRVGFFHALNGYRKVPRPQRDLYRPGEAIYRAADYLEKNASPGRRKIVILISWFNPPLVTAETHLRKAAEVTELLDKIGATVYGLYLTEKRRGGFDPIDDFPFTPKKMRRRSGGTIEQFVEQTGGSILVGKREGADDLLIKLMGLIGSSYTIGYYPENSDFDGRFRRISLELSGRGKAKAGKVNIKTRNGYRALRPSLPDAAEIKN
jgi:VWFA-related protein